jgi:metallo-beta-lactamase family protein
MDSSLQITFHSGVGSVTGANFLLESPKTKILVDCGLIQGTREAEIHNKDPFPYDVAKVDFLFITHAHMDHIGRVCKLVRDGFRGTIYSTPETKDLANVMITDAIKVMDSKMRDSGTTDAFLYDNNDFNQAFSQWKTIEYHNETKIGEDFSVYLKDAGHILGSSMYEFKYNRRKIVFTGDSGNSPTPILNDTEKITDADYLVVDSVYGDRNHEPKGERDKRFKQIILDTINNKGALVIPAFSVERTQVILYELNNLVEERIIPSVPVYLDSPLALKVTDIYAKNKKDFNPLVQTEIKSGDDIFNFPKLTITHGGRESAEIENTANPKIIIAGSGMSAGGRVVNHEIKFLPDPKSTILLMGYQALGTLGRKIQDKPKEIEINGQNVPVKARIEMISGYSSHKDSDSLVKMVEDTASTVRKVFVVMGEPKSSLYLTQRLRDELGVDAISPTRGKTYKLDV